MNIIDNKLLNQNHRRKRRGNSRYFVYFALLLLFLIGAGIGVYQLLSNLPLLNLQSIQLAGNSAVPDSLILKRLQPYLGQNLLRLSKSELAQQVCQIARIKETHVSKRLWNTLRVKVEERQGVLYVRSLEGDLFPIDSEGVILEKYGSVYRENLPLADVLLSNEGLKAGRRIRSESLERILATHRNIIREAPEFVLNISEYYTVDKTVYIIDARNGMRLIPSKDNIARQFSRYEFVQQNGNVKRHDVLDLRFADQVVVKADN